MEPSGVCGAEVDAQVVDGSSADRLAAASTLACHCLDAAARAIKAGKIPAAINEIRMAEEWLREVCHD